ncbi:MAG: DUF2141 domain-containing protein [Rubrivivax sp.]
MTTHPALFAALLGLAGSAQALDLTVEVLNTRSNQGLVNVALYAGADTWLKAPAAAQRVAVGDKTLLVFRGLAAGSYAVSLFHDENGNGKMDSNAVGMPIERYGFSRDARGMMGPPAFADAAVELQADTQIGITLK